MPVWEPSSRLIATAALLLSGCASGAAGPGPASDPPAAAASSPEAPASPSSADPSGVVGPMAATQTASATPSASHSAGSHLNVLPQGLISGNLGVVDQVGDGTRLRLSAEIDGAAGWVVVQADRGGRPGRVLGTVHRGDGVHDDIVVVRLRPRVASTRLWVTLYLDRGRPRVFEPGGADRPLQFNGRDLRRPARLTVTTTR